MHWFIGTSGFMVNKKTWFDLPSLNCIEINSTFYSLPREKTIQQWKDTKPGVYFSLKCSKYITHIKRLKDCKEAWKQFWERIKPLGAALKAVLIQLPPSFKNNGETYKRVETILTYLPINQVTIVFEFRDDSWFTPSVYKLFKKYKATLGGTAIQRPTKKYWLGNLPTGIHLPPKTSDTTYLRIHGQKGYKGNYDTKKLDKIRRLVKKQKTRKNFVMFNNTFFPKRNKTCKIKNKKIRYAAVCDAVKFGTKIKTI